MDANLFSLKYSYNYILSTVPVSDINTGLYIACARFAKALVETSISLLSILFYLVIFLAKIITLVFPHAVKLAKVIYDFHRTKLTKTDIFIEIVVLSLILIFFIFKKRILKFWSDVELFISKKSKSAAQAAPHVLFFGVSFIVSIVGKKFIMPLTNSSIMPLFTLIVPLITTSRVIYTSQNNTANKNLSENYGHKILLWVVLAIYHAMVTILSLIPFSNRLLYTLPYIKELMIVIIVWVQLSPAFTAIVFKSIVTPILKKIATILPATASFEAKVQQSGTFVKVLKMMRMITDKQEDFLRSLLQDSVATLIAVCFIFTPNPFATVGMVTIALLLPAFRTAATTSALVKAKITARNLESDSSVKLPSLMAVHRQWLDYWVCVGVLWCVRIYGFTFWPSIMMLTTLWLQHSYFLGASKVIRVSWENVCMLVDRNHEMQRQRQMERLQELQQSSGGSGDNTSTSATTALNVLRMNEECRAEEEERRLLNDPESTMNDVFSSPHVKTPAGVAVGGSIATLKHNKPISSNHTSEANVIENVPTSTATATVGSNSIDGPFSAPTTKQLNNANSVNNNTKVAAEIKLIENRGKKNRSSPAGKTSTSANPTPALSSSAQKKKKHSNSNSKSNDSKLGSKDIDNNSEAEDADYISVNATTLLSDTAGDNSEGIKKDL